MIIENEPPTGWHWVAVTLAGAVAVLWRVIVSFVKSDMQKTQREHSSAIAELKSSNAELRTRSDACEEDRANIRVELATVKTELDIIKSRE
ncbi:hypothetical protein CKO51_22855 [Rhodopirellula sp. SM50]|nr:hypothetical protein [Rhodopirellula sp. SM50]PAY17153.1 hypothetical protein CKO51_22855 [Rhodopirellula sp. SM50]